MSSCGAVEGGRGGGRLEGHGKRGMADMTKRSLLRRGFKEAREGHAALVEVVLVRHHDLQLVLPRLPDLLGQPLVRPGVLVQVEQHVGRVAGTARRRAASGPGARSSGSKRGLLGRRDGEAGKRGGELVGQLRRARVGRRGPERHGLRKGERVDARLTRHVEAEGVLPHEAGRGEEHRLVSTRDTFR